MKFESILCFIYNQVMENYKQTLDSALDLIKDEDFSSALSVLKKLAEDDSSDVEIYKNIGLCEINLDNPIEAKNAFSRVLDLVPDDALSLFYLANCYMRLGDKDEAIEKLERVLELRPNYLEAYKNLAMLYLEFANPNEAVELVKKALNNPEITPDYSLYYILSTCYMIKKEYKNAANNLEEALKLNPDHIQMINSLAVCYMNTGELNLGFPHLKHALELEPDNALTNYNLGIYRQTLDDYTGALKYFQVSYQKEPSATMLSTLANCSMKAGQIEMASSLYKNLVAAYPNNFQYRLSYIETLEQLEKFDTALENVNMLLSRDEKNIALVKKKGALLRKLHRNIESVEIFSSLLKRGKIDVEVYYNLAFNYVETGDFDDAKEMFKKCIILEPQNPYAHKDLGVLYLKMNLYDWAVEEIEEAIKLEGDVAEFHMSLGVAYLMLSRLDDAKTALNNSLKYDPNEPDTYAYLGYIDLLNRNYEASLVQLKKALQLDSDHFLAKTYLAKYYFVMGKYEPLKQLLLDIVEKTKDDETMNMLAIAYLETGEFEPAMGILSKLIVTYPENHMMLTNLAKCEYNCNKKKEALEHLRQALMMYDDYEPAIRLLEVINNGK